MAGDIEESFRLSFQADSLHSGSISFGRFEAESLSWERRSSFSHNRYLEEAEKYSKPGSVTEKKAYFEAHFKKKALLSKSSSECQNGMEYQTGENGNPQNTDFVEEFENVNEGSHCTRFDESVDCWEYDGACEVMEFEREYTGVLYSESQVEPAISSTDIVDGVPEHVKPEEAHQTENGNLNLINTEPEIEEDLNDEMLHVDVISKATYSSPSPHPAEKDDSASLGPNQIPTPKMRTTSEAKPMKPRLKPQANVTQVQRTISREASKDSAKKPIRMESEVSLRTKNKKTSSQTAAPTTRLLGRTSKMEGLGSSKEKIIHENKSMEKELRTKKVVESQSSVSDLLVPSTHQTANRPKQTVSSSKPGVKQSAAVFNFRSDERAERRKEYFTKLEEKMHAKEAQMNQIQTQTLEKTEAQIKQFRKSLNFKATPMPSFYHESMRGSDRSKAVLSNTKSSKLRSKSALNPVAGAAESSSSYSKTGSDRALSASEPVTNSCVPSDTSHSPTSATNINHPSGAGMYNEITGKKEKETDKEKDKNSHKHGVSDGSKLVKGQRVEGKQKVGAGRSSNGITRKDMKGVDVNMGSDSKMGHLAVGVVS